MGFRHWLSLAGAMLLALSIKGDAQDLQAPSTETVKPMQQMAQIGPPELLPLSNLRKLTLLEKAYLDAYSILKQNNACSQFFGGPVAIQALNRLASDLRPAPLDRLISVRMMGHTTNMIDTRTGFTYRVFDRAELNLNGPFFSGPSMPFQAKFPSVGSFSPNTREARATLLLHELGHMIPNPNGRWLLPDDGNDLWQSEENTRHVLKVCGDQINAIHKFSIGEELLEARPRVARAATADGGSGR
jgi:hypothetical protein